MMTPAAHQRLSTALAYYTDAGYTYRDVPWIVGAPAYDVTRPAGVMPFVTLGGFLVASAEQSFIERLQAGEQLGKSVALAPCFRHEEYDRLHLPYFMKVELVETGNAGSLKLTEMIELAQRFFDCYVVSIVVKTDSGYDLIEASTGIELGSYGIRRHEHYEWIYGTGLAEPRLQMVLDETERRQHL